MKLAIGLALFVVGGIIAAGGWFYNSMGDPVGPLPVFGGGFIALVGLILAVSAL